jgi:hypothetical protein
VVGQVDVARQLGAAVRRLSGASVDSRSAMARAMARRPATPACVAGSMKAVADLQVVQPLGGP